MKERLLSVRNKLEYFLAYSLLLLIPIQLGKHFWPPFSFILGSRIDYLSPTIYFTDVLVFLLFAMWLFSLRRVTVYNLRLKNLIPLMLDFANVREAKSSNRVLHAICKFELEEFISLVCNHKSLLFLSFLIFLTTNILLSERPLLGWYELLKLGEFIFFGRYIASFFIKNKCLSLVMLAVSIILESLLAIAQFIHQGSFGGIFYFFGERIFSASTPGIANVSLNSYLLLRPYATFPHPNVLAGYLVVVMTILLGNIRYKDLNIKHLVYPSAIILGTIALLLTLSRIAILLWFSLLVFIFIKQYVRNVFKKRLFLLSFVLISFLILFLSFFLPFVLNRFLSTSLSDESVILRETLAKDAASMVVSHPFFGVGLHNILVILPMVDKYPSTVFTVQPVHNIFLLIAAETGIPGLLLTLWFVLVLYKKLLSDYGTYHDKKFILFLLIALTEILVLGQVDHYWLTIQQGQLTLALVIGLVMFVFKPKV